MAFLQTSDHGMVNVAHVTSISTYQSGSDYGVRLTLTDGSVVVVESVGTFAVQADAMAAAQSLVVTIGLINPS